jgi:hypothetical protein
MCACLYMYVYLCIHVHLTLTLTLRIVPRATTTPVTPPPVTNGPSAAVISNGVVHPVAASPSSGESPVVSRTETAVDGGCCIIN